MKYVIIILGVIFAVLFLPLILIKESVKFGWFVCDDYIKLIVRHL